MKRWSKLQKQLYALRAPEINLQIHCALYRMQSQHGSTALPRYWITLDKEIIWDYPKECGAPPSSARATPDPYPYQTDIADISDLLRAYLDTPKDILLHRHFENDHWGLIDILRAADRRFGTRRLNELQRMSNSKAARKILQQRCEQRKSTRTIR